MTDLHAPAAGPREPAPRPLRAALGSAAGRLRTLAVLGACGLLAAVAPAAEPAAPPQAGVQAELEARVRAAKASQAVLMLADRDGRVQVFRVGEADADSRFEWGSVTKALTGSLLARLTGQGRVSLDTPLSQAWPALQGRPAGAITLRQLATHHAGLPRLPDHATMAWSALRNPRDPYAAYTADDLDGWLLAWPGPAADRAPAHAYSNLGFGVLGRALAALTGEEVEALLARELLRPAGAAGASFGGPVVGGRDGQGWPTPPWRLGPFAAAGALRATPGEMLPLLQAARDGRPPFDGAAALAQQPQASRGGEGRLAGLGWAITERHGDRIVWHNGGTGGHRSFVGYSTQTGRAIVVAANGHVELDALALHALNPAFALAPATAATLGIAAWMGPVLVLPGVVTLAFMGWRRQSGAASVALAAATWLMTTAFALRVADWRALQLGPLPAWAALLAAGLLAAAWAAHRARGLPAWPAEAKARRGLAWQGSGLLLTVLLAAWVWRPV